MIHLANVLSLSQSWKRENCRGPLHAKILSFIVIVLPPR